MLKGKSRHNFIRILTALLLLTALVVFPHAETGPDSTAVTETAGNGTGQEGGAGVENSAANDGDTAAADGSGAIADTAAGEDNTTDTGSAATENNDVDNGAAAVTGYTYEDDQITVTAIPSAADAIPAGAMLSVTPITAGSDNVSYRQVAETVANAVNATGQAVTGFLAYDIGFTLNGVTCEPTDGNVNVTIQYKTHSLGDGTLGDPAEVKVLHLKDSDGSVEVEDLSDSADISNDSAAFVTASFSTFVVTGVVTGTSPSVNVTLQFLTTAGAVDTSVSGTYYLYVYLNGYRCTLTLNVSAGVATATLSGLYDQNGSKQNNNQGGLYPLTNTTYTTYLFSYNGTNTITANGFRWDDNNYVAQGYTKYEAGSNIAENFTVTGFSNVAVVNNSGSLTITATAKPGTKYTSAQLTNAVAPVLPYGVFTNTLNLYTDMEGNIAAQNANLYANFGNSDRNRNNSTANTVHTFTVNKTYTGSIQKTFTFGLFKNGAKVDTAAITLPTTAGATVGSASFTVYDSADGYTVAELNSNGTAMAAGDQNNGTTLTTATSATSSSSSTNSTSYIQNINFTYATPLRNGTGSLKNNLVAGANYTVSTNGNETYLKNGGTTLITADSRYCALSAVSGAFPIDFAATLSSMENLSKNLATALTSDTVMVKNMTYSEFNVANGNALTFNTNGKMLVLNIDATGYGGISLFANAAFKVNDVDCGGYSLGGNNIIVNIYTKSGTTYTPYSGTILNAGYVMGVLLVPDATIYSTTHDFTGTIVANSVTNTGAEIHGVTYGTTAITTGCTFVNTPIDDANYDLPSTGGRGTYTFYILGGILMLAAVTALFTTQVQAGRRSSR